MLKYCPNCQKVIYLKGIKNKEGADVFVCPNCGHDFTHEVHEAVRNGIEPHGISTKEK